ncbi:MAG: hypothetical protein H0X03_02275 [Nitrosopumilus sp.]|nr:hypothetical protein [Nitrosopumilus sp.]
MVLTLSHNGHVIVVTNVFTISIGGYRLSRLGSVYGISGGIVQKSPASLLQFEHCHLLV